ncbi:MAG: hypothetical protein M1828_005335 [Chrysothrix sp. TS-e1954]|nr:MAG: hypothetical protein M1828_005335 [Chrysothrix sp. TS-e1954]
MELGRMRAAQLYVHADDYHAHLLESRHDNNNWNCKSDRPLRRYMHQLQDGPRDPLNGDQKPTGSNKLSTFRSIGNLKSLFGRTRSMQRPPQPSTPQSQTSQTSKRETYQLPAELSSLFNFDSSLVRQGDAAHSSAQEANETPLARVQKLAEDDPGNGLAAKQIEAVRLHGNRKGQVSQSTMLAMFQHLDTTALRRRAEKEYDLIAAYKLQPIRMAKDEYAAQVLRSMGEDAIDWEAPTASERERIERMQRRGRLMRADFVVKTTRAEQRMMGDLKRIEDNNRRDFFEWRAGPRRFCRHQIGDFWMIQGERNRCRVCTRELNSFSFKCFRCQLVTCHECHYALHDAWCSLGAESRERDGLQSLDG